MKHGIKISIAISIMLLSISFGFIWSHFHKRSFYTLDELLQIESDASIQLEETMVPFQPREYIRKVSEKE
ncbi:hypothetical protein [Bacillus sp. B1-b2]|uniref:hypothetical protein n=1 Tax=Bacillus sp. B1-b2 TaxID=2653201 RepID=UPI0012629B30|nr:hypothetical protein [Bacillus sp. B1-b2]KAB7667116.1 hypothetical protein F9279_16085 [Bacillus sp. B1-b2]